MMIDYKFEIFGSCINNLLVWSALKHVEIQYKNYLPC